MLRQVTKPALLSIILVIAAANASALDLLGTNTFTGGTGIKPEASSTEGIFDNVGIIRIPKAANGHFYTSAYVNNVEIQFLVDTGATTVALSFKDAQKLRLNSNELQFNRTAETVNGPVNVAVVILDEIKINGIKMNDVRALVTESSFQYSLLGMSYLSLFSRIELTDDFLLLYP